MPYTPELGEAICERLKDGVSLLQTCRELNIKESTVRWWALEIPEFSANYARARELGDDAEFERLTEMAAEEPRLTAQGFVDSGWVTWKKNQIDTHKWSLARKRPKKYGDKLQHSGDDDNPIQFVVTRSGRK